MPLTRVNCGEMLISFTGGDAMTERNRKRMSLLDEVLDHRIALYALAAGAALAAVPLAQARVIFTPKDVITKFNSHDYNIDLNHDGMADLYLVSITEGCGSETDFCFQFLDAYPLGTSTGFVAITSGVDPSALQTGAIIGSQDAFTQNKTLVFSSGSGNYGGNFRGVSDRFLGVRFLISGQVHYGWVAFRRVSGNVARLGGWAYETEPNKAIVAGNRGESEDSAEMRAAQPTGLELLAMGYTAIAERQRRIIAPAQS